MTVLLCDVVVKCPKTGDEVKMTRACMATGEHWTPCQYFRHWGIHGCRVFVTCSFKDQQLAGAPEAGPAASDVQPAP